MLIQLSPFTIIVSGELRKIYKGPVTDFKIPDDFSGKYVEIFVRTTGRDVEDITRARIPCSTSTRNRIRNQKDNLDLTYDAWLNRAADVMEKVNGETD